MKEPTEKHKYKQTLDLNEAPPSSKGLIKVICPSCSNSVPSANININDKLAKCDDCDGIFSLNNNHDILQHDLKPEVLQPEGVEVFHFQNEVDISFKPPIDFATKTLLIGTGTFGLLWSIMGLFDPSVIELFYLSIPLLITAFFTAIRLIVSLQNKIYITIDDKYLSVVNRPYRFTFPKDRFYLIDDIDQVYVKKRTHPNGKNRSVFELFAIAKSSNEKQQIKLIPMLENESKARYLKQEIERYLNITDRLVIEKK